MIANQEPLLGPLIVTRRLLLYSKLNRVVFVSGIALALDVGVLDFVILDLASHSTWVSSVCVSSSSLSLLLLS